MKKTRLFLKGLCVFLVLCIGIALLIPWRSIVEQRLVSMLEAQGIHEVKLTVTGIGFNSLALQDISINHSALVTLKNLTVEYSPIELWRGHIGTVTLSDITLKFGDITVLSTDTVFRMQPSEPGTWKWAWESNAITLSGLPVEVPKTKASGMLEVTNDRLNLQGKWSSDDRTYAAQFTLDYPFASPEAAQVRLATATLPWSGGSLSVRDTVIPLSSKAYRVAVIVKAVSLDALLQPLTGKRASATGTISGTLPVLVKADGSFVPQTGRLEAGGPGKIVMQPDAIPGDNAQVALVREVMKDFHYSVLSAGVETGKNDKLSVNLSLEGNNPAAYDGRPVKLNVHLGGDVLDFIKQSMAVNDPQSYIQQGSHAK